MYSNCASTSLAMPSSDADTVGANCGWDGEDLYWDWISAMFWILGPQSVSGARGGDSTAAS